MKLCVDCKFHITLAKSHYCMREEKDNIDPVTGAVTRIGSLDCNEERKSTSGCGLIPKYWEAK